VVPEAHIWVVPSQCWDAIASSWQAVWLHAGSRWAVAPCHAPFMPRSAFMPQAQYAVAMLYTDFGGFIDGADDVIVM